MDHFIFRTFKSVWNWQHKFYSFGPGLSLWWPVTFVYMGCLVLAEIVVWGLAALGPVSWLIRAFGLGILPQLILPFVLANWLTKASLDGKTPFMWLRSQIRYIIRPRLWQRGRPVATWWLLFPPAVAFQVWQMIGWNPLPPRR